MQTMAQTLYGQQDCMLSQQLSSELVGQLTWDTQRGATSSMLLSAGKPHERCSPLTQQAMDL